MGVVRRYPFTSEFEHLLAATLSSVRPFADRFARDIDPDLLTDESVALIVRAVRALVARNGHGPTQPAVVIQQIRIWVDEGKISPAKMMDAADILSDTQPGKEDDVAAVVIEPLKQVAREHAVKAAIAALSKPTGMEDIIRGFENVDAIGRKRASTGIVLGAGSFETMVRLRNVDKLPTGITPLDIACGGGLPRGQQGVLVAGTGAGKSFFLSSQGAVAAIMGLNVAYATLELEPGIIFGRMKAALLDMPINDILGDRHAEAEERIIKLAPSLGMVIVESFPAKNTTHLDIYEWLQRIYQQHGRKVDVLLVDYADKMCSPKHRENDNSYVAMNTVYEGLRLIAAEENLWEWTASQSKGTIRGERGVPVPPKGDDAADSKNKSRVTDVLIGMAQTLDRQAYLYEIDKFRTYDCQGVTVGPVPHKRWCGRMFL